MLRSIKLACAPLFSVCLAAFAGCDNPAPTPPAAPVVTGAAGGGSVAQPSTTAAAGSGGSASPALPVAGSAVVVARSPAPVSGGAGAAAGVGGAVAGAGGAGGVGPAAGSGGTGGSAGAAGSSSVLPITGDDMDDTPPAANSCQDLFCFDLFDCAIFHPDEAATCNFTACENFVCK